MREENARLKRIVAALTLDKQILPEVIHKKAEARRPRYGATIVTSSRRMVVRSDVVFLLLL